jgi:hypothetical protein
VDGYLGENGMEHHFLTSTIVHRACRVRTSPTSCQQIHRAVACFGQVFVVERQ